MFQKRKELIGQMKSIVQTSGSRLEKINELRKTKEIFSIKRAETFVSSKIFLSMLEIKREKF